MKTVLLFAVLLAGCAQQPQRTLYDVAWDECQGYGFKPYTQEFSACVQREVQGRRDMAIRLLYGR